MLVELAVGDAYGAGFEGVSDLAFVRKNNDLSRYIQHPHSRIKPGCYTDDTQMSIAIAEAVVSDEPWTPEMLAQRFVASFKRDPREGYAGGFYNFLRGVRDGADFLARIRPNSDRNGAAMRAAPLGVYRSVSEVVRRSATQAAITHNTPEGVSAAIASALTSHYLIYRLGPKSGLGDFLATYVPRPWTIPWQSKVGLKGTECVHAAVTAITASSSMSDLLRTCVQFTGDVDTVAAIALAAGSCCDEIDQDLPAQLVEGLENGAFGREFLAELDERLMQRTA
jgi:ADP-ribosyl-[dinitrogen reductase] hydrolase